MMHRVLSGFLTHIGLAGVGQMPFSTIAGRLFEGANTQTLDGILKDHYESFISEKVNQKNPWMDVYKHVDVPFGGRETVYTAHVSRNTSPMFVGEEGAFAEAGVQGHVQVRVHQKKLMGRVRITPEAISDTSKGEYAWKQARKDEMDGLIKDLSRREEYALTLDGRGVLARVDAADPDAAVTMGVDAPGGIANDNFGNRFIMVGMYAGFVDPVTGLLRSGIRKVVSVSADGTTVTFDSAVGTTVADNDYVVQAANASVTDILDTSYENAYWGVMANVDDGTYRDNYFGVDRDIYTSFNAYVSAATGPLSVDIMQQSADVVDQKMNGKTDCLAGHHSIRRLYIDLTFADRRYQAGNLLNPDAGTKAFVQGDLTMGGVEFKAIRDLPLDVLIGLDRAQSNGVCYVSEKGKWVDEDGRILVRVGSGSGARDAFEAWYRQRKQYHLRTPEVNWRLDGITGQSLVVVRPSGD